MNLKRILLIAGAATLLGVAALLLLPSASDSSISGTIGPDGGSLSGPGGSQITIPAGSAPSTGVRLTISELSTEHTERLDLSKVCGTPIGISPETLPDGMRGTLKLGTPRGCRGLPLLRGSLRFGTWEVVRSPEAQDLDGTPFSQGGVFAFGPLEIGLEPDMPIYVGSLIHPKVSDWTGASVSGVTVRALSVDSPELVSDEGVPGAVRAESTTSSGIIRLEESAIGLQRDVEIEVAENPASLLRGVRLPEEGVHAGELMPSPFVIEVRRADGAPASDVWFEANWAPFERRGAYRARTDEYGRANIHLVAPDEPGSLVLHVRVTGTDLAGATAVEVLPPRENPE